MNDNIEKWWAFLTEELMQCDSFKREQLPADGRVWPEHVAQLNANFSMIRTLNKDSLHSKLH
jgi:hypothetical protein